ncbi:hypothetical protein R8510_05284 [Ralstonia chuxiongensis]|nr:hypothetical protein R8510_05284 [Ralstonia chuxiongensis]
MSIVKISVANSSYTYIYLFIYANSKRIRSSKHNTPTSIPTELRQLNTLQLPNRRLMGAQKAIK